MHSDGQKLFLESLHTKAISRVDRCFAFRRFWQELEAYTGGDPLEIWIRSAHDNSTWKPEWQPHQDVALQVHQVDTGHFSKRRTSSRNAASSGTLYT